MVPAIPEPSSRDIGRLISRVLCCAFALIGAVPLLGAFLLRSPQVQAWAAEETARILRDELGIEASYQVSLELVPFRLGIRDLVVPSSDGKGPALRAEAIYVTPRVFSLLAGQLDAGDIEIERPVVRLVFEQGKLKNLEYRLKEAKRSGDAPERAPFRSLAMTEASLDVRWDERRMTSTTVDLDILAEPGSIFEVALRLAEGTLLHHRASSVPGALPSPISVDEDAICRVDLRLSTRGPELMLRRLSLLGLADQDQSPGTRPSCHGATDEDNPERVAARISSLRMKLDQERPAVNGHVMFRIPARLANRFIEDLPFEGWLGFAGDVGYDGAYRLPQVSGRAHGAGLKIDGYTLAHQFDADVQISGEVIRVPQFRMQYADADVTISKVRIDPFESEVPIRAESVDTRGMTFPGLMRDLDVTHDTIVSWDLDTAVVTKISGTLSPFVLNAEVQAETSGFEVTDIAYHKPNRRHMVGVERATVRGKIKVDESAFQLIDTRANFGSSSILVRLVSIGFDDEIHLIIPKGARIDLKDISPLVEIPMAGVAQVDAELKGEAPNVVLTGNVAIQNFEFGGFPVGDVLGATVRFVPLKVDISDLMAKKGTSPFRVPSARLDFDSNASVKLDAMVESNALNLRDFLAMWKFEDDPRWTHLRGVGGAKAAVHYVFGGPEDRCGGGNLRVVGSAQLDRLEAFEERYDGGNADFDFHWSDVPAGYRGFSLDVPSFSLSKGTGKLAGSFHMTPGAKLAGKLVATGVPISKLDALGERVNAVEGSVTTAVGEMTGTLDAVDLRATAALSTLRLGNHTLPPSDFSVRLVPQRKAIDSAGTTRCGQPIAGTFDRSKWERDEVEGTFYVSGQLFGGQVEFNDLALTSQRSKVWSGRTQLRDFNLAALLELFAPGSQTDFTGTLSGEVDIAHYPMKDPARSNLRLTMQAFSARQGGLEAKLASPGSVISLQKRKLELQNLALSLTAPNGQSGVFDVQGELHQLGQNPQIDAELKLRPTDLSAFIALIPKAERAKGKVNATLGVHGPLASPDIQGGLKIADGEVELKGLRSPISELFVDVQINPGEVRVTEGTARIGNGRLRLRGRAPIQGTRLGTARANLEIKDLGLTLEDGIRVTLDSNLRAVYHPSDGTTPAPLPMVNGDVTVTSFDYTRPMSMTADLSALAKRGKRTEVVTYDPEEDALEFDIQLRSQHPLRIKNELLDTELVVDSSGLRLKGTNQRFGMVGRLKLKPGGQIKLRNHEFEIRQGWVRFDDLSQIEPQVDVTAVTDYRRFEDVGAPDGAGAQAVSTGSVSSGSLGGQWRINLHAYGHPENLKIDLTSTPTLPQDDIFLLLTVGLTRAELDQSRSAAVGSSVALEALGTLSGADRAVKDAVPVIDDASMGTAYNPKSGRTEPTITIGKRLAEKIRAQVTTGLSDSSKVESSLRWQMNPQVSIEGSYGNVNDISSSSLGNLGADIRWRLEFD